MPGSVAGGRKAAATNKAKDPDFYRKIGSRGGSAPHKVPRGFAAMTPEKVREAGIKGGKISRRKPSKKAA